MGPRLSAFNLAIFVGRRTSGAYCATLEDTTWCLGVDGGVSYPCNDKIHRHPSHRRRRGEMLIAHLLGCAAPIEQQRAALYDTTSYYYVD